MRGYIVLLVLALATAFSAGYVTIALRSVKTTDDSITVNPSELLRTRLKNPNEYLQIDLSALYSQENYKELTRAESLLPNFEQFDAHDLETISAWIDKCDFSKRTLANPPAITKLKLFEKWRCKLLEKLPDGFLKTPPLMHPSGKSYGTLARAQFSDSLKYVHISEVEFWQDPLVAIDIQKWTLDEYTALSSGSQLIFGSEFVWVREGVEGQFVFRLYPIENWTSFWAGEKTKPVKYRSEISCYGGVGYTCWTTNITQFIWKAQKSLLLVGVFSVLLLLTCVFMFFKKMSNDRAQKDRQRFALQMLAHELRTPIASLKLACENLRNQFDNFKSDQQSAILRIFDDVERLRRVADRSQAYLSHAAPKKKLEFRPTEVESIKELLEDLLSQYTDQIEWKILGKDRKAKLDPYWLQVATKNLIENALLHGERPAFVSISILKDGLTVAVQDHGEKKFDPNVRGVKSSGLGIGLGLVKEIAEASGGKFQIQYQPTRVTFVLPELKT